MAARRGDRVPEFRRGEGIADPGAHLRHQRSGRVRRGLSAAGLGVGRERPARLYRRSAGAARRHSQRFDAATLAGDAAERSAVIGRQFATAAAAAGGAPQSYPSQPYPQQPYGSGHIRSSRIHSRRYPSATPVGQPLSLNPPGLPPPEDDEDFGVPGGPPHPYYGGPAAPYTPAPPSRRRHRRCRRSDRRARLWSPASAGPVEVKPPATLACPIVSALDQWITAAVQPAALKWFRQPVVEIKQISAYSCRGMNGDPNAHISEHAFGNALDIAEFTLADGHKISVQYGWQGTPEEQGFLHDVQAAACEDFTTVLAPGANVYHYNHIHVDLMRHYSGRHICEPAAIPAKSSPNARGRDIAAQHGEPGVTGSIETKPRHGRALGYSREDDDGRPEAVPGDDSITQASAAPA